MKSVLILVVYLAVSVYGQTSLLEKLKIVGEESYFSNLVQETMYEVEKRGWCNLKLDDFNQTLNDLTHTNMLVTGHVDYINGFVVSIEKIDVSDVSTFTFSPVVYGIPVVTVMIRGHVNFRHLKVGYDVIPYVTDDEKQRRYTGVFTHSLLQARFEVSKDFNANAITMAASVTSLSGGSGVRMVYMPTDEISEILSLRFAASSTFENAENWMKSDIGSIMLELAATKVSFPEVCFNC